MYFFLLSCVGVPRYCSRQMMARVVDRDVRSWTKKETQQWFFIIIVVVNCFYWECNRT
jgi:hypothetical protein